MKISPTKEILSLSFISIIFVFSQWGFFNVDIAAIGINTAFSFFLYGVFLWKKREREWSRQELLWFIPICLVLISFVLYENPWLKIYSLLIFPLALGLISTLMSLKGENRKHWDGYFMGYLIGRTFSPLGKLGQATNLIFSSSHFSSTPHSGNRLKSAATGILILIPLAVVVIFLLTSVDPKFAKLVSSLMQQLAKIISDEIPLKILISVIVLIVLMAASIAWSTILSAPTPNHMTKSKDDLKEGIVVSGLALIYVLFLWVQLDYLLIGELPLNFDDSERVVKSGFWQMFILSAINVVLYSMLYRRTGAVVQNMLRVFVSASGLLVFSATWRVFLYNYYYGLSYEKFFAGVTCLYAIMVFGYLIFSSFSQIRKNILRWLLLSFIWCYALISVLPIENVIFKTNTYLASEEGSRVNLIHLQYLSLDVKQNVIEEIRRGNLRGNDWITWLLEIQLKECRRPWYESNLSRMVNCRDPN